jgi:hypothetical protein
MEQPFDADRLVFGGSLLPPYPPPEVTPLRYRLAIFALAVICCAAVWAVVVLMVWPVLM